MDSKEQIVKDFQDRAARLTTAIVAVQTLGELPPYADLWGSDGDINIRIPFDPKKLLEVRRCIGRGWKYQAWRKSKEYRYYNNGAFPGVQLVIGLHVD